MEDEASAQARAWAAHAKKLEAQLAEMFQSAPKTSVSRLSFLGDAVLSLKRLSYTNRMIVQHKMTLVSAINSQVSRVHNLMKVELAAAQMDAAGREAQFDAFVAKHPNSPLMADSGERFKKSGNVKTNARRIYEQAFDAKGVELRIANPAQYRND